MPERPRPGEPHRSAGTVVRLHCWAQLAILPREYKIAEIMIDLNNWYKQYQKNPDRIQFEMAQSAARELFDAVQTNYYGFDDLKNLNNRRIMTQLQQFLFELSFEQTRKIREYILKRYNVYCGSMKDLEQAINDYIPNEDILEELSEVLA